MIALKKYNIYTITYITIIVFVIFSKNMIKIAANCPFIGIRVMYNVSICDRFIKPENVYHVKLFGLFRNTDNVPEILIKNQNKKIFV